MMMMMMMMMKKKRTNHDKIRPYTSCGITATAALFSFLMRLMRERIR